MKNIRKQKGDKKLNEYLIDIIAAVSFYFSYITLSSALIKQTRMYARTIYEQQQQQQQLETKNVFFFLRYSWPTNWKI